MMNLAVLIDYLIPGGVQLEAIEEVKYLNRNGHHATLLILVNDQKYRTLAKGIPHVFLSPNLPNPLNLTYKLPFFSFFSTTHLLSPIFTPKYLRDNRFDLVISHGSSTSLTALALKKYNQTPFVAVIHDPIKYILKKSYSLTPLRLFFPILIPLAKRLELKIGKEAQAIFIDSQFHLKRVKKAYHQTPFLLPLGASPKAKIPKKRGPNLLALSRWQNQKNPYLLANLLEKLPKAKLIMAGAWLKENDKQKFIEYAKLLKVRTRIKLMPKLKDSDKPKLFSLSRCWIHPNEEAFGLGGLEAMAHGVPIVMPKKSGVASLFTHGLHGFFPSKTTTNSFLPYLKKLLNDERLAWKMGRSAWKKTRMNFSWEKHTTRLLHVISENLPKPTKKSLLAIELGHLSSRAQSGGDKLFRELIPFIKNQVDVTILIPSIAKSHWKPQIDNNLKTIIIEPEKFTLNHNLAYFLAYLTRIIKAVKLLKNKTFDIIMSTNNQITDVIPAYFYKQQHFSVRWIARVHHLPQTLNERGGNIFQNLFSVALQNLTLALIKAKADCVIALNHTVYQSLVERHFPKPKLSVIGTGIDTKAITNYKGKNTYDFDAVAVGRVNAVKGSFDLPDIWFRVLKKLPQAKLAIIGEVRPLTRQKLFRELIKRNIEYKVKILGFVSEQRLLDTLKSSKVFLMTDHEAGWSLASAEAMACGLPVIAYANSIFGDVFKKGFVTVELGNKKQFSQKIVNLLSHPITRKKISIQAKNQAHELDIRNIKTQVQSLILSNNY